MSIVSYKPTITRKEMESVLDCLINDELTTGGAVTLFERSLSDLTNLKYCVATNSLAAAYHLSFLALEITAQDEVIIPSFFNIAPLSGLQLTGGQPVLVDVADNAIIPSIEKIKEKITDKTKAIIVSHMSGINASFEELKELHIPIIEDISHAIGAECDDKPAGNNGAITVASFTPLDMITTGNGGAVFTKNPKYYSVIKNFRSNTTTIHFDYTMTDFQGAMGISQLAKLQDFIKRRREIAQIYYERMRITPHKTIYPFNDQFVYQAFPIIFDASQDKIEKYWKKTGIQIFRMVAKPLHEHLGWKPMDYPQSDRLSKKLFSLPIYPTLTRKEIDKISRNIAKFI